MFDIFGKKSEIGASCTLHPQFIEIAFKEKGSDEAIPVPLNRESRRKLSERIPKTAVAFSMVESFFSNLVTDFEPDLNFGKNIGFDEAQLRQPPISFDKGSLLLSYPFVYAINFGEQDNTFGLSPSHLKDLGVPKYHTFRIEVVPKSVPKLSDFRIQYTIKNEKREIVEVADFNGSLLTDTAGNSYVVMPSQAVLIRRLETHKATAKTEEYKSNQSKRLQELAEIKSLAVQARATLHQVLRDQNIVVLQDMDYEIGRGTDDEVVLRPVLPHEHSQFDNEFQTGVHALGDEMDSKAINLKTTAGQKIQVVLSSDAKSRLKKINELRSSSQEVLETVIADPEKFIGSSPRAPIDTLFSARVGHLIFGKGKISRDGEASGTKWADGFEGHSVFWTDSSGRAYNERIIPTPDIYEKMKLALISAEKRCEETGSKIDPEENVKVDGVESPVSLHTILEICKRVESMARPILKTDDEIELARKTIETAKTSGSVVVDWDNGEAVQKIPLDSLEKSLPQEKKQSGPVESVTLAPKTHTGAPVVDSPYAWDWKNPLLTEKMIKPPAFKSEVNLQDHQKIGASWLHYLAVFGPQHTGGGRGAIVADDMGVGKTIQVLAYLSDAMTGLQDSNESILIVAPLNLINNSWMNDGFVKFFNENSINIYGLGGGPRVVRFDECPVKINKQKLNFEARRWQAQMDKEGKSLAECDISSDIREPLEMVRKWMAGKIVLCSYETLRINSLVLGSVDFRVVVLDEAQRIKNENALQANAAKALKSKMNIAMSGTPIENTIVDLWNLVDFALPGKLGTKDDFREAFHKPLKEAPQGSPERDKLRKELEEMLNPIWLRRTKKEIYANSKNLPDIVHHDSLVDSEGNPMNSHLVPMSEEQFAYYSDAVAYLKQVNGGERLAAIQKMLQLCLAPWLYTGTVALWANHKELFKICPKLEVLMKILETIRSNSDSDGQKCLLFVNLLDVQASLASFIRDWHLEVTGKPLEVFIFNGEVKPDERDERLRKFKQNPGFQVLIISARSGGVGLNLQDANHVIHYSREWNPAVERQATDRAYRIGQKRTVNVYYPITSLKSKDLVCAEEHLAEILRRKREVVDDFTLSTDDLSLTADDLMGSTTNMNEKDVEIRLEDVGTLDPIDFEVLVAILLERRGYKTVWVGQARDRGADVLAFKEGSDLLIQVKHTKVKRPITESAVGDPRRAKSTYDMKHNTSFKLALVTNHRFSERCYPYAQEGDAVELWDVDWLAQEMSSNKVMLSQIRTRRTRG